MTRLAARTLSAGARLAVLLALLAVSAGLLFADDKLPVPLKKVVLYNSGVGFFQHAGDVEGNARIEFKFNVENINDLLKSMVLQDLGGGEISTITYGSKNPAIKTLKTFAIDLTDDPTLGDLLWQIRGEKVQVRAPDSITGAILGIERRQERVGKDETISVEMLNLRTSTGLRSVALDKVVEIKILDEKLDAELAQALDILAARHSTDKKSVQMEFRGKGKRPVRIGYIQETPVWKTTYRLVLDDNEKPFLQGWAIVENTTEHDWDEVSLTLVSGRPVSFTMDLYQPLFAGRPLIVPELFAALRPRVYDQDLAGREAAFRRRAQDDVADGTRRILRSGGGVGMGGMGGDMAGGMGGGVGFGGYFGGAAPAGAPQRPSVISVIPVIDGKEKAADDEAIKLGKGVASVARADDVGELFRYAIATPVTLAREQSAMLPIINESIQGEKLSIYNPAVHAKHPLNGLKLVNSTELHLMQGPITVFDGGAYAGDARIEDLAPHAERLISYALDLETEVVSREAPEVEKLLSVRIAKGVATVNRKYTRTAHYTVKNSGSKPKQVLIERPVDKHWDLAAPATPTEKARDTYRFSVEAKPGKPVELAVVEEHAANETVSINKLEEQRIALYRSAPEISPAVKKALTEIVAKNQAIAKLVNARVELVDKIEGIEQEQSRIRQNMEHLDKQSNLYQRYILKFTAQEDQIESLRKQLDQVKTDEQKQRSSLDEYLLGLDLT